VTNPKVTRENNKRIETAYQQWSDRFILTVILRAKKKNIHVDPETIMNWSYTKPQVVCQTCADV
jgi:hypothetical protein